MIDVREVTRRFGRLTAIADASFSVAAGEIVALLGPNGAGKTTMSRIVAGILAPSAGDVIVDGLSVRADPDRVRARCGMVTDAPSLYERMTLRAYLDFFCGLYDVAHPEARIADLCALLGLTPVLEQRLGAFSRGMKQKAAIARALVHDPPVLLLDEPATALDPEMTQTLRELIVSLRARHRAILLCTHDLDEAQRIADRVVIVDRGRIVRVASTAALRAGGRPRAVVVARGDAARIGAALAAAGVATEALATANGDLAYRYDADGDAAEANTRVLRALLEADASVVSLVEDERTLEEAYLATIREARS